MVEFMNRELKLTTRRQLQLEKRMGRNPIDIFIDFENGKTPKLSDIVMILQAAIGDISEGGVLDLYDAWIDQGHNSMEIPEILADLFLESGLLGKPEKN